jgi:hypothetical protein
MTAALQGTKLNPGEFVRMSQQQLDDMFSQAPTGPIPQSVVQGTAILFPGTVLSPVIRWFVHVFIWKGKAFENGGTELRNRLTPFGIKSIRAKVSYDTSWLDGKKAILIDYSKTSFVAQKIRDEIREVAPGVYLGKVWWGKTRICDFALEV